MVSKREPANTRECSPLKCDPQIHGNAAHSSGEKARTTERGDILGVRTPRSRVRNGAVINHVPSQKLKLIVEGPNRYMKPYPTQELGDVGLPIRRSLPLGKGAVLFLKEVSVF